MRAIRVSICAIMSIVALTACGTNAVVCDRAFNKKTGKFTVSYQDDADTTAQKTTTTVNVDIAEFVVCKIGDKWPNCKRDAREFPDVPDVPNNPKYRNYKLIDNQKKRIVCVDSISFPEATITNSWTIGTDSGVDGPKRQGTFQTCFTVFAGQRASIKSEHHREPSTLVCTVWMFGRDGKKKILDFEITQALGDCSAKARIP